jgi:hypothetical protein
MTLLSDEVRAAVPNIIADPNAQQYREDAVAACLNDAECWQSALDAIGTDPKRQGALGRLAMNICLDNRDGRLRAASITALLLMVANHFRRVYDEGVASDV